MPLRCRHVHGVIAAKAVVAAIAVRAVKQQGQQSGKSQDRTSISYVAQELAQNKATLVGRLKFQFLGRSRTSTGSPVSANLNLIEEAHQAPLGPTAPGSGRIQISPISGA